MTTDPARAPALGSRLLVVPVVPDVTGNGLAMRAGLLLEALTGDERSDVHVVVIPVSGPVTDRAWVLRRAPVTVVSPVDPARAREHTTRALGRTDLRDRLARTSPLPHRAALAPPTLAEDVRDALGVGLGRPSLIVVMRTYLAPLAIELGRQLGSQRVVVDVDDDDATLLRSLGDVAEAEAYERLARAWLGDADAVFAASSHDALSTIAHAVIGHVGVLPNAVSIPADVPPPPEDDRLLFLGNLTYAPNRLAAERLAREIFPIVRRARPNATLTMVGPHDQGLAPLGALDGVQLIGAVPDVASSYARADVVVAPIDFGAGTRIKVLEAFAHRRPVVATPKAVAGLTVAPGAVATASSSAELAEAVDRVLGDRDRASTMVDECFRFVRARHDRAVVVPLARAALAQRPSQ